MTPAFAAAFLWLCPQDAVDARAYRADVELLASDAFEGRRAGERGGRVAAQYLASRMAQLGLEPLGDIGPGGKKTYFQAFTLGLRDLGPCTLAVNSGGTANAGDATTDLRAIDQFVPIPGSADGAFSAPAVFVGYGITAPECKWDDYAGIDVRGKVAVALRHEPFADDETNNDWLGRRFTRHASFETKAANAARHGAVALLVVPDIATFPDGKLAHSLPGLTFWKSTNRAGAALAQMASIAPAGMLEKMNETEESIALQGYWILQAPDCGRRFPIPTIFVGAEGARAILDAGAAESEILEMKGPRSRELPLVSIEGKIETRLEGPRCTNVVGLLRGSDPELSKTYVVVGGHFDHVGMNKEGEVWNGADDNASGAAAMLAIAGALRAKAPRRSVIFVGFDAEEVGLVGSFVFTGQPPVPIDSISAMVNCDMIGRGGEADLRDEPESASKANEVFVSGAPSSPVWDPILAKANVGIGLDLTRNETFFDRSDQAAFYFRSIPILFFNTGEHGDYHGANDTAARLNFDKALRVVRLAARCAAAAANLAGAPPFVDFQERVDVPAGKSKKNWDTGRTRFLERSDL